VIILNFLFEVDAGEVCIGDCIIGDCIIGDCIIGDCTIGDCIIGDGKSLVISFNFFFEEDWGCIDCIGGCSKDDFPLLMIRLDFFFRLDDEGCAKEHSIVLRHPFELVLFIRPNNFFNFL